MLITLWNCQPRFLASYIQIFSQDLLQYAWKISHKISNKLHFRKFGQHFLQSSHIKNFQPRFLCKLHEEFPKQSVPYKFFKNSNNSSNDIFHITIFQSFLNPCNLGILHVQQTSSTISNYFYLKLSKFQNISLPSKTFNCELLNIHYVSWNHKNKNQRHSKT